MNLDTAKLDKFSPEESVKELEAKQEKKNVDILKEQLQKNPNTIEDTASTASKSMIASVERDLTINAPSNPTEAEEIRKELKGAWDRFQTAVKSATQGKTPEEQNKLLNEAIDAFAKEIGGVRGRINGSLAKKGQQDAENEQSTAKRNQEALQKFVDETKKGLLEKMVTNITIEKEQKDANARIDTEKLHASEAHKGQQLASKALPEALTTA